MFEWAFSKIISSINKLKLHFQAKSRPVLSALYKDHAVLNKRVIRYIKVSANTC